MINTKSATWEVLDQIKQLGFSTQDSVLPFFPVRLRKNKKDGFFMERCEKGQGTFWAISFRHFMRVTRKMIKSEFFPHFKNVLEKDVARCFINMSLRCDTSLKRKFLDITPFPSKDSVFLIEEKLLMEGTSKVKSIRMEPGHFFWNKNNNSDPLPNNIGMRKLYHVCERIEKQSLRRHIPHCTIPGSALSKDIRDHELIDWDRINHLHVKKWLEISTKQDWDGKHHWSFNYIKLNQCQGFKSQEETFAELCGYSLITCLFFPYECGKGSIDVEMDEKINHFFKSDIKKVLQLSDKEFKKRKEEIFYKVSLSGRFCTACSSAHSIESCTNCEIESEDSAS